MKLKTTVRNLIKTYRIVYMWGVNFSLACDKQDLNILVTQKTMFYSFSFTLFQKIMLDVFILLVQKGVFVPLYKEVEALYSLGSEVRKHFPYHYATDHSLARCLKFLHDVESLVNMGNIQVEFFPCN